MSEVTLNPLECALDEAQTFRSQADALRAENAKLRETLQRRNEQFEGMTEMWVERGVENAKLRELVAELYQCSRQCGCDRCGYKDGCAMFDRMAQMGVEAD